MVHEVFVIGVGMGNPSTLTRAAHDALRRSELIIGARRLLDGLDAYGARKEALVAPGDIAALLRQSGARVASVVMSGDVGFHSGATRLYEHLSDFELTTIPGISSLQYLCARLRVAWQDVHVVSAHGRACDVAGSVQCHEKTFVLLGGSLSAADACAELAARGLGDVRVSVGERLSYADERIVRGTAAELAGECFGPLCVMLVENDRPLPAGRADGTRGAMRAVPHAPHLADDAFARGPVPMTKEEVRELAICKLRICAADVVWDVGAGTGSVSVEAARAAYAGQVLAVERSEEARVLLARNKGRFGLTNLRVVAGEAPDALAGLPAPDCVFVGGSGGRLDDIVRAALAANPSVRLCVAAITLETLCAALACVRERGLADVDIVSLSVAKAREAGVYHLMQAHNPVFLVCAGGRDG